MPDLLLYAFNTFVSVFVIVDPFAVVPVYLMLTERFTAAETKKTRQRAIWVSLGLLLFFAYTGMTLFNLFGITLPAFQIAGGLLLLNSGMAQLNGNRRRVKHEEEEEGLVRDDVSVFPLATPLLAGPAAISTVVLQGSGALNSVSHSLVLGLTIMAVMCSCYFILKSAGYLYKILGQTGLNLLTRIMGVLLTAVAVQSILNGISGYWVMLKG